MSITCAEINQESAERNRTIEKLRTSVLSRLGFAGGLLVGAGLSALVPWSTLESVAPGARLACVAGLGVGFVLFRILATKRRLRAATGAVTLAVGGFLLSAGPHFAFLRVDVIVVEIGAVFFLCGLTLLFRSRAPSPEERKTTIDRLLNDTPSTPPEQADRTISRVEALECLKQSFETEPGDPAATRATVRLNRAVSGFAENCRENENESDGAHGLAGRASRGGLRR